MANDTLTIALNGEVTLAEFTETMKHFTGLVNALSAFVASKTDIEWIIVELETGSAVATIAGVSLQEDAVERVVQAYTNVGRALQNSEPIPYSEKIREEAIAITKVIDGKITSIRFETRFGDATIYGEYGKAASAPGIKYSYGIVTGTVETLNRRGKLRFTLYEPLFDKAITCYLVEGQEDLMRAIWGKRVKVAGRIGRDPDTGKPINVRDIRYVVEVEEGEFKSYEAAMGLFPLEDDAELPEDSIRQVRDAE